MKIFLSLKVVIFIPRIVSGDLRVIKKTKLRKLLSKRPNYREPETLNYNKCKQYIESSITSSIDSLAVKYNLNVQ